MGLPAPKLHRATYADLEAVPPNEVAEILGGVLHTFPRPAPPHAFAASQMGIELGLPYMRGRGGPGGWWILPEPELHLGPSGADDVVVPDIAGWRVERMPSLPATSYFSLAPDWICEILSARTEATDRVDKMLIYAREGVRHAWLIHPIHRTLELFSLDTDGHWKLTGLHKHDDRVRAAPFDAIELDLSVLWTPTSAPAGQPETPPRAPPKRKPSPKRARNRTR